MAGQPKTRAVGTAIVVRCPSVHGGVLWGDNVNKRFYLYGGDGGEWNVDYPPPDFYHLWSYDIINNKWDDFGSPNKDNPPNVASYGAGVGVSETGMGYYYGGWISNTSMSRWTQPRTMSSRFYAYDYAENKITQAASPDNNPRAEGAMVWIPAGDARGLLVYMGGIVSPHGNGTAAPQPFNEIFVFDATGNSWWTQTATGEIPQNRRQFCIDVAWAPDKSSFNISSCNMVKSMSQLFVIGGSYTNTNACDQAVAAWAQHNFWTGTSQNAGNNKTYWALYDHTINNNVVPIDVYNVTGGDKHGRATLEAPKAGFDSGNEILETLLGRKPSIPERTPTRKVSSPTTTSKATAPPHPGPALSTGAIVGIAIGGTVALALVIITWFCIGRRVVRRRKERRLSQMTQVGPLSFGDSPQNQPSMVNRQTSAEYRGPSPTSPQIVTSHQTSPVPPSELPTETDGNGHMVCKLPYQGAENKGAVSPDNMIS
ncbi:hypothetical protein F53441_11419 [Fusarium austroafricanum]|uniref:Kelch repeat protein n=1 Tax=Fusarium austroafricanum TaxID=2364996 RepID=A0A8H4K2G7_9HYPO|nr:hypothetical protein F53441_11419 [Fusarium austroafricanum]